MNKKIDINVEEVARSESNDEFLSLNENIFDELQMTKKTTKSTKSKKKVDTVIQDEVDTSTINELRKILSDDIEDDNDEGSNKSEDTSKEEDIVSEEPESKEPESKEDAEEDIPENPTVEDFKKSLEGGKSATKDESKETSDESDIPPKEELQKMEDYLLRTLAEMENLRKRTQKEIENTKKYAVAALAQDLIVVLENLRLAEDNIPEDKVENDEMFKNILEGIKLTRNELLGVFTKHGIERIDPKGEPFDHNFHQAVTEIESPDHDAGTIVEVYNAGYIINDRLLRPAMVAVAKAGSGGGAAKEETKTPEKDEKKDIID